LCELLTISSQANNCQHSCFAFIGYLRSQSYCSDSYTIIFRPTVVVILSQMYVRAQSRSLISRPLCFSPMDLPRSTMYTVASFCAMLKLQYSVARQWNGRVDVLCLGQKRSKHLQTRRSCRLRACRQQRACRPFLRFIANTLPVQTDMCHI